jgi:IMP cyclohydrolase
MIELLHTMRYPGRFIAIGRDGSHAVIIYGATGRSLSSLARRFVRSGNAVFMSAVDATVGKEGNPELLEYPALRIFENGAVAANGRHIDDIRSLESRDARKQLSYALSEEAYEPDEYRTPRITGCIVESKGGVDGALHIIRSVSDGIDHASWSVPMINGRGMFISTYAGDDVKPTPSFRGSPRDVSLDFGSAERAAEEVFLSLAPNAGESDYRVGCLAVYKKAGEEPNIALRNRK